MLARNVHFKICSGCGKRWFSRDDLLYDPEVSLLGYQMHFKDYQLGLYFFNHNSDKCKTTFALKVSAFNDLYNGPVYKEEKMADNDCPLYCLRRTELRHCNRPCACAFIREIMEIIQKMHQEALTVSNSVALG